MFESISYSKSPYKINEFDLGLFSECLLFYRKVGLFANESLLTILTKQIGLDNLEYLINHEKIDLVFTPWFHGTRTFNESTHNEYFDFCSFAKVPAKGKEPDVEALFMKSLERGSQKKGKSRRVGRRIFDRVRLFDANTSVPLGERVPDIARRDIDNKEYFQKAIVAVIKNYAPEYPINDSFYFHAERHSKGFNIISNIDLDKFNKLCVKSGKIAPTSKRNKAHIVDHILKADLELFISSYLMSDITTDEINSSLIELKCTEIYNKLRKSQNEISLFQSVVFDDGKMIRESINSGEHSFDSVLPIIEESDKFHKWTNSLDEDSNLIREYYEAITTKTWIDKLPSKILRFSFFTGAGLLVDAAFPTGIGTATGIALGASDSFLIDNIVQGWKPNQYIQKIQASIGD